MLDLSALPKKARSDNTEYVGTRVDVETRKALAEFVKKERISVATLLVGLIKDFLKEYKAKGMRNV